MTRFFSLALLVSLGCQAAGTTLELADPGPVDSVMVRFGTNCRLLETPREVEPLVTFLRQQLDGWEPFWGEPEEPDVETRFRSGGRTVATLGIGRGQLMSRVGERAVFKPVSEATTSRLLELMGGSPTAAAERPCPSPDE